MTPLQAEDSTTQAGDSDGGAVGVSCHLSEAVKGVTLYNHLAIWSEDSWGRGEDVSLAYIVGWGGVCTFVTPGR